MAPSTFSGVIAQLSQGRARNYTARQPASLDDSLRIDEDHTGTVSSFQPEHESTQQFDTATQDNSMQRDLSGRINLAQSPSSAHSDSIELGRGVKRSAHYSSGRRAEVEDISENPILSLGDDSLYQLTGTPPLRSQKADRKSKDQGIARRAATVPMNYDLTKTSDIVIPFKPSQTNAPGRRTLSDMHDKAQNERDASILLMNAPQMNARDRSTRFATSRQTSGVQQAIPTRFTATGGLSHATGQTPRKRMTSQANDAATLTGNQSFMLPDLPNITELVSGVRKDGTPVFSRTTNSRSRFTSASYGRGLDADTISHARLHSIPVPMEEKAIFASLQLLKEKVEQLELDKSTANRRLEEYEDGVMQLRSQAQYERGVGRPDSGFGSDEDGVVKRKSQAEVAGECILPEVVDTRELTYSMAALQASIKTMEEHLGRSDRKLAVSADTVKRMTNERDNLVTQLGVAFYSNEELRDENQHLVAANQALKVGSEDARQELQVLVNQHSELQDRYQGVARQLEEARSRTKQIESRKRFDTREDKVRSGHGNAENVREKRRASGNVGQQTQHDIIEKVQQAIRQARADALSQTTKEASARSRSRSKSRQRDQTDGMECIGRVRSRKAEKEDSNAVGATGFLSDLDLTRSARGLEHTPGLSDDDDSKDITYLSFLDPAELSRLRKKLEEERRAAKGPAGPVPAPTAQDKDMTTRSAISARANVPRKSSLRDVSGGWTPAADLAENTHNLSRNVRIQSPNTLDAISYEEPSGSFDTSMISNSSRRPASKSFEEMTSGFILPDITLHRKAAEAESCVGHKKDNCTMCTSEKESAAVVTPTPVTERDVDETCATVRPSQAPPVALATVLKQLEDEVKHLKMQLAAYESAYASHDPSLGRRKRKALKAKIDKLLDDVERRSEQIYSLYDVLEGQSQSQKQARSPGVEDCDVDETLQHLGIDPNEVSSRAAKAVRKATKLSEARRASATVDRLDELLVGSDDEFDHDDLSDAASEVDGM